MLKKTDAGTKAGMTVLLVAPATVCRGRFLRYSPYPIFGLSNGVMPISLNIPLLWSSQGSLLQPNKQQSSRIRKSTSMCGGLYVRLLFAIKTRSKVIVVAIAASQNVMSVFEFQNFHLRSNVELLLFGFYLYFVHNE